MKESRIAPLRDLLARSKVFAANGKPLRIAFRVDAGPLPAWIASCVEAVAGLPETRVALIPAPARPGGQSSFLWSWFDARVRAVSNPSAAVPSTELPNRTEAANDDIVVNCSSSEDPAAWWFALDGRRIGPDLHEFFWHAASGPRPIELSLESPRGVLGAMRIPPVAGLYWTQHAEAMNAAPALMLFALIANRPAEASPRSAGPAPARSLGPLPVPRFIARKVLRSLWLRLPGTAREGNWQIALNGQAGSAPHSFPSQGWHWMNGFEGHDAADPFVVEDRSNLWLFYEDVVPPKGRGRLAVRPALDENAKPVVILEKPYHLSYPCVFHHGGEWWMIPESSANATVDLYRAKQFPFEWARERTLQEGASLVDTTPLFHDGLWYFFTTAVLPGRALASLLFTAEDLTAPWRLHPSAPISLDTAESRGAGSIFSHEGRLYRPVQDCLVRYGYALSFREILELTPASIRERTVSTLLPDWHPGLTATHTFSRAGGVTGLDGRRR